MKSKIPFNDYPERMDALDDQIGGTTCSSKALNLITQIRPGLRLKSVNCSPQGSIWMQVNRNLMRTQEREIQG